MCEEICDILKEQCYNKKCCKIFRRIFEFICLVIGTILLGLAINSWDYVNYFIFLSIYGPIFYMIYYFPRCCLDSDCLEKSYKCKRNIYFVIMLDGILFIIFIFVIIVWAIVNLAKVKKTKEKVNREVEPYKIEEGEYGSFLAMNIFGLLFVLYGISSIVLEVKIFKDEFLYYKLKVKNDEKEKEKENNNNNNNGDNLDQVEEIKIENYSNK